MGMELKELEKLWKAFGDIPIDNNDYITEQFMDFPAGTDRQEVWRWFENQNRNFSVGKKTGN